MLQLANARLRAGSGLSVSCCCSRRTAACRQDMQDQPKYIPLRPSDFFADGRSARPLIEGTVARGHLDDDAGFYTGKGPDGKLVDDVSLPGHQGSASSAARSASTSTARPATTALGTGNGMIVRRGYRHPPSYHIDRLRQAPDGYIYDVITNGFGAMPDYSAQIQPRDRWAIVAYVRALQLSQNASHQRRSRRRQRAAQPGGRDSDRAGNSISRSSDRAARRSCASGARASLAARRGRPAGSPLPVCSWCRPTSSTAPIFGRICSCWASRSAAWPG